MTIVDKGEARLRARIGAYSLHAQGGTNTAPARRAFLAKFLAEIPTNLPENERLRRAASAKRAHFSRLALKSVQARRRRAQRKQVAR